MHSAPSVSYPVGRSRFAGAMLLFAWLMGAMSILAWWAQAQSLAWRMIGAVTVVLLTGIAAAMSWWRMPGGELVWDGESWSGSALRGSQADRLQVILDLQLWMWVRCSAGSASRWLWVEQSQKRERWIDLRRAVYSRARPQALLQPAAAAAKS